MPFACIQVRHHRHIMSANMWCQLCAVAVLCLRRLLLIWINSFLWGPGRCPEVTSRITYGRRHLFKETPSSVDYRDDRSDDGHGQCENIMPLYYILMRRYMSFIAIKLIMHIANNRASIVIFDLRKCIITQVVIKQRAPVDLIRLLMSPRSRSKQQQQ